MHVLFKKQVISRNDAAVKMSALRNSENGLNETNKATILHATENKYTFRALRALERIDSNMSGCNSRYSVRCS